VSGSTVAVAAGTRLVGVDNESRSRLFDIEVSRLGAGELWVFEDTVAYELAPSVAPGGGIAVLDLTTGVELWRATSTGNPTWVDGDVFVSSTANTEPSPAPRFVLVGRDGRTGGELWRTPSTAEAFEGVVGATNGHLVVADPHPAVAGAQRVRLLDATTGDGIWTTFSTRTFDHAVLEPGAAVTLYGSSTSVTTNRGTVSRTDGRAALWTAALPDGISQAPLSTNLGTLVISGERAPVCMSRTVGEPETSQG